MPGVESLWYIHSKSVLRRCFRFFSVVGLNRVDQTFIPREMGTHNAPVPSTSQNGELTLRILIAAIATRREITATCHP